MPNIHPWNIGMIPPISPMITKIIPSEILNVWRITNTERRGEKVRGKEWFIIIKNESRHYLIYLYCKLFNP